MQRYAPDKAFCGEVRADPPQHDTEPDNDQPEQDELDAGCEFELGQIDEHQAVYPPQHRGRKNAGNEPLDDAFDEKRSADEPIGGTDELHRSDEQSTGVDRQADGVGDEEDRREYDHDAEYQSDRRQQAEVLLHLDEQGLVEYHFVDAIPGAEVGNEGLQAIRICIRGLHADFYGRRQDRKSTRLNSSHVAISYAVFCLKKKINMNVSHDDKN